MRYLARLSLLIVVGLVLCIGVSRVTASGENGNDGNPAHWLLYELRRSEALEQRMAAINRASEAKHTIVAELVAGRQTGRGAIEQFRAVNQNLVEEERSTLLAPYRILRTQKDLEKQLFSWIGVELHDDPQQVKHIIRQLKEEFARESEE